MKRNISAASQQRRKFWENHLRAWQASGLSRAGYCGLPGGGAEIATGAGFASLQAAASHAGESIRH